jgi:DNA polymerase-3 subunit alpha
MSGVVHLKVCSEYSLLYSAARLADIAKAANEESMHALGVADRNGLFGGLANVKTLRAAGLQPVMGSTLRVVSERMRRKVNAYAEITVFATSFEGYTNLTKLATLAGLHADDETWGNTWTEVQQYTKGLLCLAGDRAGPLQGAMQAKDDQQAIRYLEMLQTWFGKEQVYIDLCSQGHPTDAITHEWLASLATSLHLPYVATTEIRHVRERDLRLVDVLTGIGQGLTLEAAAALRPAGASYHFRGEAEMKRLFKDYPEALATTLEIANRCAFELPFGERRMPIFPLTQGQTEEQALRRLATEGLHQRVRQVGQPAVERLEHELQVITSLGFCGYFLIVWDFMRFAHERGISTGPGRGSAAGSLVAYALWITDVNPLSFGLLFERFLNPERVTWPDIDIDFEAERRYEVIEYVAQKYGRDHVAQIGTLGTLAARAAVRDVARVLAVPTALVDKVVRHIPAGPNVTLTQSLTDDRELRQMIEGSPVLSRLIELAHGVEGLPRHSSVHAAGVVISREPIDHFVPLLRGQEDIAVTQYSMAEVEEAGLLKMDFLGLRTLTICDRAIRYVQRVRGEAIRVDEVPFDVATGSLLGQGDTDGCFQLESVGVKQVLREMQPSGLEDLVAVVSLYRPGPMEQIATFLKARRGDIPIRYEVPELEPILRPTYGILVYQEQIMQIASLLAGFSLGEADVLRRAISKKNKDMLDQTKAHFIEGCVRNGYTIEVAQRVYHLIEQFADYGFNRSHAVAYAMLALKTAFLKANYRTEFMAALMTESMSRPEKLAQYAQDCRRHQIAVLPPDIRYSEAECVPESADGKIGVRLGLFAIKNVGVAAVEMILAERKAHGIYQGVEETFARLESKVVSKRVLESLVMAGAFDFLEQSRTSLLALLKQESGRGGKKSLPGQLSFDQFAAPTPQTKVQAKLVDAPGLLEQWEQELIGFVVSSDPFAQVSALQARFGLASLFAIRGAILQSLESQGSGIAHVIGRVQSFRQIQTKRGESMAFLTIEDGTHRQEMVVFPVVFRALHELPEVLQVIRVEVRVEQGKGERWIVTGISYFGDATEPAQRLFIKIDDEMAARRERMQAMRRELVAHPGESQVILVYKNGDKRLLDKVFVRVDNELLRILEAIVGKENIGTS